MHFLLPNFMIMQKKDCSFRIYQNIKITHADPDHPFLAITQNWAMRLFVGFVMQGHKCLQFLKSELLKANSTGVRMGSWGSVAPENEIHRIWYLS